MSPWIWLIYYTCTIFVSMRFRVYHLDVEYKDTFIPLKLIKSMINTELLDRSKYELVGGRSFDKITGKITRKFAWDAVIDDMIADGSLEPILDKILSQQD